jgi:predicted nucleic acid-binding Zn ribbon protein
MKKNGNEHTLKEILEELIRHYQLKDGLHQVRVREYWSKEMGEAINKYTESIELRKRTLYLRIRSAALKQELSLGREKIRQLLNQHLGEAYIETVVLL